MKTNAIAITLLCMLVFASSTNCFLTAINLLANRDRLAGALKSECKKLTTVFTRGGKCSRLMGEFKSVWRERGIDTKEQAVAKVLCRHYGRSVFSVFKKPVATKYGYC